MMLATRLQPRVNKKFRRLGGAAGGGRADAWTWVVSVALAAVVLAAPGFSRAAAGPGAAEWAADAGAAFEVRTGVTYLHASGRELQLDIYRPRGLERPNPTVIVEQGWRVVNVGYHLALVAPAPAADEDCRCTLRWVAEHAAVSEGGLLTR